MFRSPPRDHSNVLFFNWQHICLVWWTGASTNVWYLNGYELCSPTHRFVLHAYDADILQGLLKYKDRKLAQTFNSIFRYIDDVLSLINSRLAHYLHHIYSNELEAKDSTDTQMSAYYLDLHLENVNGGRLRTKVYDKRDDFTFPKSTSPSLVAIFHGHQRM